jgi:hypothetical protein
MILYDGQVPADQSPSTNQSWRPYYTFLAFDPLIPPYPDGTELFRARHSSTYPYELIEVVPVLDVYNVDDPGTYFVAFRSPYPGTTKLPFRDVYVFVEQGRKLL